MVARSGLELGDVRFSLMQPTPISQLWQVFCTVYTHPSPARTIKPECATKNAVLGLIKVFHKSVWMHLIILVGKRNCVWRKSKCFTPRNEMLNYLISPNVVLFICTDLLPHQDIFKRYAVLSGVTPFAFVCALAHESRYPHSLLTLCIWFLCSFPRQMSLSFPVHQAQWGWLHIPWKHLGILWRNEIYYLSCTPAMKSWMRIHSLLHMMLHHKSAHWVW